MRLRYQICIYLFTDVKIRSGGCFKFDFYFSTNMRIRPEFTYNLPANVGFFFFSVFALSFRVLHFINELITTLSLYLARRMCLNLYWRSIDSGLWP